MLTTDKNIRFPHLKCAFIELHNILRAETNIHKDISCILCFLSFIHSYIIFLCKYQTICYRQALSLSILITSSSISVRKLTSDIPKGEIAYFYEMTK